ncbi:MAG: SDR family oxidoreductase [Actinobacteria bacterium]|nr:SDR family oxidoreductase [Actinomycetota bacterium]
MSFGDSDFRLEDRTIAVVGAGRGIGAGVAEACAAAGAERVVLLGRTQSDLAAVAETVAERGSEAQIAVCDVTSTESIVSAFEQFERVDVLVEAAGANQPEPFVDVDEETFDRLFALNVRGVFFTVQAAVKKMLAAQRGGVVVIVSSQMGHVGAASRSVYCASKHALEGLTKALGVELAVAGIRVVTVAPTFVRTAMTAAQLDDPEIGAELLAQIPRGRFGEVDEVARAVVLAASPAASLMTGSSLILDGGWTAR